MLELLLQPGWTAFIPWLFWPFRPSNKLSFRNHLPKISSKLNLTLVRGGTMTTRQPPFHSSLSIPFFIHHSSLFIQHYPLLARLLIHTLPILHCNRLLSYSCRDRGDKDKPLPMPSLLRYFDLFLSAPLCHFSVVLCSIQKKISLRTKLLKFSRYPTWLLLLNIVN